MGLARDGGLFVPESLPEITLDELAGMKDMDYRARAVDVMARFLEDFSKEEVASFAGKAYNEQGFDTPAIAPLRRLDDETFFLELWHGPTCAFKDMALQMLPHLLTASLRKTGEEKNVCILVATSGDTGKAALEGFADVERTKILVFYPENGVSEIQQLQMVTQRGENVGVCAVKGNFDDAQTGVKNIFSDEALRCELAEKGWFLSSANSINWGRLLPQIAYYVSAYADLLKLGRIELGEKINVCVPTGNFGNILAAYYAREMGVPINKLICASNSNNVLTDFINTGVYDRNRDFYTTISPSMDIIISSNLERLLFMLSGGNDAEVRGYMKDLSETGRYKVSDGMKEKIASVFSAGFCSDEETKKLIGETFRQEKYLIDTHTAVGFNVLKAYREQTGDATPAVIASTASPYKFCDSVLEALGDESGAQGLALIDALHEASGVTPPRPLLELKNNKRRFDLSVEKTGMAAVVSAFLK